MTDALVTTQWLADELGADDLRVVDATYFGSVPGGPDGDPAADFVAAHIPGAVFLDLASLADTATDLPSMLPPPEQFSARMGSLGIGDGDRIVLYDHSHYRTAARAWWMLRAMGARNVAILDGGFAKWQAEARPVESGSVTSIEAVFTVRPDPSRVRTLDQMMGTVDQILDARSPARFSGNEPDPRPAPPPGHIPGSKNLPYACLFNPDGTWKRSEALKAEFDAAGIDLSKPLVTTCGSGITAAVLAFGAHLLGNDAALYDGSWSEWGADPATPKATGAA